MRNAESPRCMRSIQGIHRKVGLRRSGPLLWILIAVFISRPAAAKDVEVLPAWLAAHVGDGEGKIAEIVLRRARTLYREKLADGRVHNGCYLAMDATRPNVGADGTPFARFYVICESTRTFRSFPAGHGSGRDLPGLPNFSNGRQCAKNFGNAADSFLTAGGAYVTAETKTSFKGDFRASDGRLSAFSRAFVQYDGEGETANARARAIGGHEAATLKNVCLLHDPADAHADASGFVLFGSLVEYGGGRSDGCTSWRMADAAFIVPLLRESTTLYIYPERRDIAAVDEAIRLHRPAAAWPHWDRACLRQIGAPRFWSAEELEPIIRAYETRQTPKAARSLPLCQN